MKRKTLALLLAVLLALSLLPAGAGATGEVAEVWTPDMQTQIGKYPSLAEAFAAANEAGMYAGVKLLQDAAVGSGTTLTLTDAINLFLNDHTLTLESGAKVAKGGSLNYYPAIDLWNSMSSSPNAGNLVINGTLEANLCLYGTTVTVNDGGSVEMLDAYSGTVNINGGSVHALITDGGTYNISGGVMCLDMFDNNGEEDVAVTVSGNACLAWGDANGIQVVAPQYWDHSFHLTLAGGYYDADPRLLYRDKYWHIDDNGNWNASTLSGDFTYYIKSGDTYTEIAKENITDEALSKDEDADGSIFVRYADVVTIDESQVQQYSGQADWAEGVNTNLYKWRIVDNAVKLSGEVNGATVAYTIENLPAGGAKLLAARYDGGKLTDVKLVDPPAASGEVTLGGSGAQFKLFLVNGTTYAPLCAAWKNP